jgi:hypothetical protein
MEKLEEDIVVKGVKEWVFSQWVMQETHTEET